MSSPDCVFRLDLLRCTHPEVGGDTDAARCAACARAVAPSKPRSIISSAATYLTAEASLALYGPVPAEVAEARSALCRACPKRVDGDKADAIGYCNSCGCGEWARSRLSVKIAMPAAFCPLGLWRKHEPPLQARGCPAKAFESSDPISTDPESPTA